MKTSELSSLGSQFLHAIFVGKDYELALSLCDFPLTVILQDTAYQITDSDKFNEIFSGLNQKQPEQPELVSEQFLFKSTAMSALFIEADFPRASLSVTVHFVISGNKIRSVHFLAKALENASKVKFLFSGEEADGGEAHSSDFPPYSDNGFQEQGSASDAETCSECPFECTDNSNNHELINKVKNLRLRSLNFLLKHNDLSKSQKSIPYSLNQIPLKLLKLKTALEHSGIFYWEYDPVKDEGNIDFFNNKEEIRYTHFTEMLCRFFNVTLRSQQKLLDLHKALLNGETEISADIQVYNKEGKEEWQKIRYSAIQADNSLLAIGTCENINEIKELKKLFSAATEQTGLYIWNYDFAAKTLTLENHPKSNFFQTTSFVNVPESLFKARLIHPGDREKCKNIFRKIETGDAVTREDLRIKDPVTDEYVWHQISFSIKTDKKGNPSSAIGTIYNIQEQKNLEEAYKQEFKLFDTKNEATILNCIYSFNEKKVIRMVSSIESLNHENLSLQELISNIAALCPDEDKKQLILKSVDSKNLLKFSGEPKAEDAIIFPFKINGSDSIWTALKITLLKNPSTQENFAKITMEDITISHIKKAYSNKLSNHRYDFILRINYATGNYVYSFGSEVQKALQDIALSGNYFYDYLIFANSMVVKEERPTYIETVKPQNILERLRLEGEFSFIYRTAANGGEIRYNRAHFFMLDENSHTFCERSIDITDNFKVEQEKDSMLHKSLQMANDAIKAKSQFLASMSHDIRTPMNAIIGMANIALEDIDNKEQIKESLDVIKSSSENLLAIINDILDVNRMESGKANLNNEPFVLSKACKEIANTFKGIVMQKEQEFKFEFNSIKNDTIIGDISNFKRILTNLLGNAVKFTPMHGSIIFKVFQEATNNPKTAHFKIQIQDTGIGISKEQMPKIFEAFQREENDTIKHIEGSGLGLAIVKALVEMQGGTISAESEKGKGTTFTLHLEYAIAEQQTIQEGHAAINFHTIDLSKKHIMLVEDHPINSLVATKFLEKMGATVITAENGEIAVNKFLKSKKNEIDFIFMDVQMPVLNGYQATKAIRHSNHAQAKTIPIIAMTANAFHEDVQKSLDAGMNAHIAKPISLENISNTLKKLAIIK